MKQFKKYWFFAILLLFVSCETEIDVSLPEYNSELVVEGWIEPGEAPKVSLYKSVPYLSTINLTTLYEDVIVKDAIVTVISGDGETDTLHLVQSDEAPLYWYYTSNTMKGKLNTSYTLKINWNSKKYSAITSITDTMTIDSLYLDYFQGIPIDTINTLKLKFTDPAGQKDYYMFKVKIANAKYADRVWLTSFPIALDDVAFSGIPYTADVLRFGTSDFYKPKNLAPDEDFAYKRPFYQPGDTIYIKTAKIDYPSFRFLSSAGTTMYFGVNPFTNPPQIYSNITSETNDKCLGSWMGLASTTRQIIFTDQK
jgi:hypothetical protein